MHKQQFQKTVIIVAGPTAVGKTAAAIRLARHYQTQIISADSRQCYRELNIGVARPSPDELAAIPHHFIATHSIHDEINAAGFEGYALQKATELFRDHDVIVMAGGTGLYIRAFTDGLDVVPPINPELREEVRKGYEAGGITWLAAALESLDPLFASTGEMLNPHRMMRALEVVRGTGKSILAYQQHQKVSRNFNIIRVGLELPRETLSQRISARVNQMMENGQLAEVESLVQYQHLKALQTVGYAELFQYLAGHLTLQEATDRIIIHTRQYAKRQMTWFRKENDFTWFQPTDLDLIIHHTDNSII